MSDIEVTPRQMVILRKALNALKNPQKNMGRLPECLPTGEEVRTVSQVAALMGSDMKTAALAVVQADHAPIDLLTEAKDVMAMSGATSLPVGIGTRVRRDPIVRRAGEQIETLRRKKRKRRKKKQEDKALHGQPDSDFDGLAIMLGIEPAGHFAIPGGLKPEQLHVTLAYYGNAVDIENEGESEEDWLVRLKGIAATREAFIAYANGITRFTAQGDDLDPIVVNIDSPKIGPLRDAIIAACGEPRSEHGFTPHMTLGYVDQEDDMPIQRWDAQPIIIDSVILGWGRSSTRIPLLPIESTSNKEEEEV